MKKFVRQKSTATRRTSQSISVPPAAKVAARV